MDKTPIDLAREELLRCDRSLATYQQVRKDLKLLETNKGSVEALRVNERMIRDLETKMAQLKAEIARYEEDAASRIDRLPAE